MHATRHGAPNAATHRHQLERLKVAVPTATRALEWLLYAQSSCAYTIRYIDDAREFLELPEEGLRDQAIIAGLADKRVLSRIAANASYGGENHEIMQKQA